MKLATFVGGSSPGDVGAVRRPDLEDPFDPLRLEVLLDVRDLLRSDEVDSREGSGSLLDKAQARGRITKLRR